jgi:hypothetical protein
MNPAGGAIEALDVLVQAEDPAGIASYALEDAVSVKKAVIVDGDQSVLTPVQIASVEIYA